MLRGTVKWRTRTRKVSRQAGRHDYTPSLWLTRGFGFSDVMDGQLRRVVGGVHVDVHGATVGFFEQPVRVHFVLEELVLVLRHAGVDEHGVDGPEFLAACFECPSLRLPRRDVALLVQKPRRRR